MEDDWVEVISHAPPVQGQRNHICIRVFARAGTSRYRGREKEKYATFNFIVFAMADLFYDWQAYRRDHLFDFATDVVGVDTCHHLGSLRIEPI